MYSNQALAYIEFFAQALCLVSFHTHYRVHNLTAQIISAGYGLAFFTISRNGNIRRIVQLMLSKSPKSHRYFVHLRKILNMKHLIYIVISSLLFIFPLGSKADRRVVYTDRFFDSSNRLH